MILVISNDTSSFSTSIMGITVWLSTGFGKFWPTKTPSVFCEKTALVPTFTLPSRGVTATAIKFALLALMVVGVVAYCKRLFVPFAPMALKMILKTKKESVGILKPRTERSIQIKASLPVAVLFKLNSVASALGGKPPSVSRLWKAITPAFQAKENCNDASESTVVKRNSTVNVSFGATIFAGANSVTCAVTDATKQCRDMIKM